MLSEQRRKRGGCFVNDQSLNQLNRLQAALLQGVRAIKALPQPLQPETQKDKGQSKDCPLCGAAAEMTRSSC
jgi:hypothetical protein